MHVSDYVVSLDIGTSSVKVIVGEIKNGALNIVGIGSAESDGINKGAIVDIDLTAQSILNAVADAERMINFEIRDIFIGVSGNHINIQLSPGVVAVLSDNREIDQNDVERAIEASKVIVLPPNKEIIEVMPKEFIVDGLGGIKDPVGMIGGRLEVISTVITGSMTVMHNLYRTVDRTGLHIAGFVLLPLAAGELVLSKDEKNLGIAYIDIGKGTTDISIYQQEELVDTLVLPVGGEYITNDISIGLKTPADAAEYVKVRYGTASVDTAFDDIKFRVPRIGSNFDEEFTQVDLARIIEPRIREIFSVIISEIQRLGYTTEFPGGVVLSGGVAATNNILTIAEEMFDSTVRVAAPTYLGAKDPSFTNGVGILVYTLKKILKRPLKSASGKSKQAGKSMSESIRDWFKDFV